MRHPIRGLLICPTVAPLAYWLGTMGYAFLSDFRLDWFQALRELATIFAFGLPIACVATLVWGAPILYALRRLGWLCAATLIAAGALGGTIVAALLAFDQQDALFRVRMPLPAGAAIGALVGATCWRVGQGKAEPNRQAA
jgi:hypothetical protein